MGDSIGQKVAQMDAPDEVGNGDGSFSSAVRTMFNALAPSYDSFNHYSSLGLDYGCRVAELLAINQTKIMI